MSFLTYGDEINYGDDFYEHYGLAYKAIARNFTAPEAMEFLREFDLRPSWLNDELTGPDEVYKHAARAFERTLVDWPNGPITYPEFALKYADLAK
jgi:hypothetical protein